MNAINVYLQNEKEIKEKIINNIISVLPDNKDENGDDLYDISIDNIVSSDMATNIVTDTITIHIYDHNKEEDKYGDITPMVFINDVTWINNTEIQIFFETPSVNIEYLIDQMKSIVKAIKESFK